MNEEFGLKNLKKKHNQCFAEHMWCQQKQSMADRQADRLRDKLTPMLCWRHKKCSPVLGIPIASNRTQPFHGVGAEQSTLCSEQHLHT